MSTTTPITAPITASTVEATAAEGEPAPPATRARDSRRRTVAMVLAPLLVLLVGVGAIASTSYASTNGWTRTDHDRIEKSSSQGGARVSGYVSWYNSWRHPFSLYGRIDRGTLATADRGCAVVTVTWLTATGGVSAGPVSASPGGASRGATAVACNGRPVDLGGIELVSRTAYGVDVQVCWAATPTSTPKYCRSDTAYANGI